MQTRHFLPFGALFVVACGSSEKAPAPGPAELYSQDEVAGQEAALRARLVPSTGAACTRALLHDEVIDGPAKADQLALLTSACATKWDAATLKRGEASPEVTACAATVATAVQRAVAHAEACSPYEIGGPAASDSTAIAYLVAAHAKTLTEPAAALWLRLDAVRFWRDLRRGRTDLEAAKIAGETSRILLDDVPAFVAKLPAAQLAPLVVAVDALLADEPSLLDAFIGSELAAALQRPQPIKPFGPLTARGMMYEAIRSNEPALTAACPKTASFTDCVRGLLAASEANDRDAEAVGDTEAKLMREVTRYTMGQKDIATRDKLRAGILHIMRGDALHSYSTYVPKGAMPLFYLAALRIALEVKRTGCPTPEALMSAPEWNALTAPARLGEPLIVSRVENVLVVMAPLLVSDMVKTPTFTIDCPPGR